MDEKNLLEKIKIAKKLVKNVDDPYNMVAFGVVLTNLLDSDMGDKDANVRTTVRKKNKPEQMETDLEKGAIDLAEACKISTKELDTVLSIKADYIQIIAPLQGSEPEKQLKVSLCVLITNEILLKRDWTPSAFLVKSLNKSGVGDLKNLGRTINENSKLFRSRGTRRYTEYTLFGPGKLMALDLVKKFAKGENE